MTATMTKPAADTFTACSRCGGSRYFKCYNHVEGGVCFRCRGTGRDPNPGAVHRAVASTKTEPWPFKDVSLGGYAFRVYRDPSMPKGYYVLVPEGLWANRPLDGFHFHIMSGTVVLDPNPYGKGLVMRALWPDHYARVNAGDADADAIQKDYSLLAAQLEEALQAHYIG